MKIKYILLSMAAIVILIVTTVGCGAQPQGATATPTTAAGIPAAGSYQPESACDNPYYPRRAGTKTQSGADGSVITETTSIRGDANKATATVTSASTNGIDVRTYECSSGGILLTEWKLYDGDKQVMSTLSYSGVFFPSAEQFKMGRNGNILSLPTRTWIAAGLKVKPGETARWLAHLPFNTRSVRGRTASGLCQ